MTDTIVSSPSNTSSALLLSGLFVLSAAGMHTLLQTALPNTGMGHLGLMFIVWPLIGAAALALFFALRRMKNGRLFLTFALIAAMAVGSVWVHPQDTPIPFWQKLQMIGAYIQASLAPAIDKMFA